MKKALLALGIAVALLAILLFIREMSHAKAAKSRYVFDTAHATSIDRLHVALQEDSVTLIKHDGHWRVLPDSFPADTARIRLALNRLLRLEDKEVVSLSPDTSRLMDFGLHAGEVKRVSWSTSGKHPVTHLIHLGHTSGIDFNSTFWKRPDRSEVYRTPGNFTHEIGTHPRDWKDKTLFPAFESDDVRSISVRWRDDTGRLIAYELSVAGDSVYRMTIPGTSDTVVIPENNGRLIFEYTPQIVIDEVPDAGDPSLSRAVSDSPSIALTIKLRDGSVHGVTVGFETEEHAYFAHPTHGSIVTMFKSRLTHFKKTPTELLKSSLIDPSAADAWDDVAIPAGME